MEPLNLSDETRAVMDAIRRESGTPGFGLEPGQFAEVVKGITEPMLVNASLPPVILNQYRWYCQELTRLFKHKVGFDLAMNIDYAMRKWLEYGLEPNTVQFIVCELYYKLKGASLESQLQPAPGK